jgi:aminoglycoside phosphotransferase (APT) family kinase protein
LIYSRYVGAVARALQQKVHASVKDSEARAILEACVRTLSGIANAQGDDEVPPFPELARGAIPNQSSDRTPAVAPETSEGAPDPVIALPTEAPPESPAVQRATADRIRRSAEWLETQDWAGDQQNRATARALLRWEKQLMDSAIDRMTAFERLAGVPDEGTRALKIDPEAVATYFRRRCGEEAGIRVTRFRQAVGGRSRQTALFRLEGTTGLPRNLVIQRDHPASVNPRGVVQEFPVLQLVADARLKVARPLFLEPSREPLGAPFIVLEQVKGTVAGPDYFNPPATPELALQLAAELARLHRVPFESIAAQMRHSVPAGAESGWSQELEGIERAWASLRHFPSLAVSAALAWMRGNVDSVRHAFSIVHNDAAFHNILAANGRITALLDWELVHIGHPAEDLGYCRSFVSEMVPWPRFVEAYVKAGGQEFSDRELDYFSLRAIVHLLTLVQYGREMFEIGRTVDVNLAEVGASFVPKLVRRLAAMLETVLPEG